MAAMSKDKFIVAIENLRESTTARVLNTPVGTLRRETSAEREAKGSCLVSRVTFKAPTESGARDLILHAVKDLGSGEEIFTIPAIEDVHAQWIGPRAHVSEQEPEPKIPESKRFERLKEEVQNPITLLYVHGAGLAFQSPNLDHQLTILPSWAANINYDIVPSDPPGYQAGFPTDDVRPSKSPRGNYYCETSILYHSLVCAIAAKDWRRCPPIYIAMGSKERIIDAGRVSV
ncbi:MAG: hypothetical protein Q9217_000854 [Psora testacea]